ncbi:hypothetical protein [Pseudomonas sediminis]|uniref:hypothetical protein n=1 Tax=Pseudomonas sediminis TaxID=1691904 RepID=UPI0031CC64BE
MDLHKKLLASSFVLIAHSMALSGCTHYAPGYDGWTEKQVNEIKQQAKIRYLNLQDEKGEVFGVNYLKFNAEGYEIPIKGMDASIVTECESLPFVKYREIGSVILKTSVCLNENNEVNRILFDYVGENYSDTKEIYELVQADLKKKYGASIAPILKNTFMKKEKYKSIYFSDSPSRSDLLHYSSVLISDYITSASTKWIDNKKNQHIRYSRFILDLKLRDYSVMQGNAATRRTERLNDMLNSSK